MRYSADLELLDAFGIAALRIPKLPSDIPSAQASLVRSAGHAQALVALQDRVAAEAEFKEVTAAYPSQPGVHYMYGVFLLKEHPPLAIDEFRRELEISPAQRRCTDSTGFSIPQCSGLRTGIEICQRSGRIGAGEFRSTYRLRTAVAGAW